MGRIYKPKAPDTSPQNHLKTMVENRSVYNLNQCELNIFETHQQSEQFHLQFPSLVFTAMFRGKKIMHLEGLQPFEYLPGESVIVPENKEMIIDFPDADLDNPTQCLALAIDGSKIRETLDILNEKYRKVEPGDSWKIEPAQLHLKNSEELSTTIDRLVRISREDNKAKDIFANFMLQELLIRLMQTQARNLIVNNYTSLTTSHRFAFVIQYIRDHLTDAITVDQLAKMACMSKPSFFRGFRRELGISPNEFIVKERIALSKKFLADRNLSISDAVFKAGFNSIPYFFQVFRKYEGLTPRSFKEQSAQ